MDKPVQSEALWPVGSPDAPPKPAKKGPPGDLPDLPEVGMTGMIGNADVGDVGQRLQFWRPWHEVGSHPMCLPTTRPALGPNLIRSRRVLGARRHQAATAPARGTMAYLPGRKDARMCLRRHANCAIEPATDGRRGSVSYPLFPKLCAFPLGPLWLYPCALRCRCRARDALRMRRPMRRRTEKRSFAHRNLR
jgi:hypothetical protein